MRICLARSDWTPAMLPFFVASGERRALTLLVPDAESPQHGADGHDAGRGQEAQLPEANRRKQRDRSNLEIDRDGDREHDTHEESDRHHNGAQSFHRVVPKKEIAALKRPPA